MAAIIAVLLTGGLVLAPMAAIIAVLLTGGLVLAPMAAMTAVLLTGGLVLAPIAARELLDTAVPTIKRNILKYKFFMIKPLVDLDKIV